MPRNSLHTFIKSPLAKMYVAKMQKKLFFLKLCTLLLWSLLTNDDLWKVAFQIKHFTHTTLFTNLVVQNREKTNTLSRHSEYSTLSRITHMYNYLA